ncbi:SDR family oxidoreductase [Streptomyces sp. FB2]|uniref:SDR family oxidoreductase n=1 Tax=Streptomyces sp. FB2 TaxID=2902454 RepID=UPI001F263DC9|nr:SDR family oxidoreductase [Streptomyces sp. FB2]MCF2540860.1 SDR family oxidoreductase [Streptomyces sp. FB2]
MLASTPSEKKVVLITGASSGIGEATAHHLAAAGHQVMAGARRTDRLAELAEDVRAAGGVLDHHALDVTRRDSVESFVGAALDRYGRIDVLVNNAGVMPLSPMADLRVDEWDRMIDVNLRGTLHGIAAVLPRMREQGAGHIVNIASVAGHRVDPTAAVYCATKHAVRALSEGLRQETRDIRVTLISPGFTQSELLDHGGAPEAQAAARTAAQHLAIPATAVAEAIGFALDQPAAVDVNEIVVRPTAQN